MKNADRPAYPVEVDVEGVPKDSGTYQRLMDKAQELGNGLTKFEKVAAMAMQGYAASADDRYGKPQEVAKDGIAAAHAFFTELEDNETDS